MKFKAVISLILVLAGWVPANAQFLAAATTLQQRIDNAYAGKGRVQLPFGENDITATLLTSNKCGLVVQGHGAVWGINPAHSQMGSRSTIVWATSDTSNPMVDVRGARTTWRDLSLHGDAWKGSTAALELYGGRPTAGFLVSYDAGLGPGKHLFDNVVVEKCTAAWQAAEGVNDGNCDTTFVRHARARDCQYLLYCRNLQGMGWDFEHCHYSEYTDGAVFQYEAGGDLVARYLLVTSRSTVLNLVPVSSGAIGSNNGNFNIHDLKVDTQARGTTLVSLTNRQCKTNINFWGGHVSGNGYYYATENKRMINTRGGPCITFSGTWFTMGVDDSIIWDTDADSYIASVHFNDCRLSATSIAAMFDDDDSEGNIYVYVSHCVNGNGDPFYDPNNPNAVAEGDTEFMLVIAGT